MIRTKRVYNQPAPDDGFRVLVDRLWPRGLSKERAQIDLWLREIAPSNELRTWFRHDPNKWAAFKRRYFGELDRRKGSVTPIIEKASKGTVTLLYAAKDERFNNAVALAQYVADAMREAER